MDFDDVVIGRPPSRWRSFRIRLSDWLHPDSRFLMRTMPDDPLGQEVVTLAFLNINRMSDADKRALLSDMHAILGIRPLKGLRTLPRVDEED